MGKKRCEKFRTSTRGIARDGSMKWSVLVIVFDDGKAEVEKQLEDGMIGCSGGCMEEVLSAGIAQRESVGGVVLRTKVVEGREVAGTHDGEDPSRIFSRHPRRGLSTCRSSGVPHLEFLNLEFEF